MKKKGRRGGASREAKGLGKSAMTAGAGAGVFYLWDNFLKDQKTLNEHWYARAGLTFGAGYLLKRKSLRHRRLADGIIGASGFMFAQAYKAHQDAEKAKGGGQAAMNTSGWLDAGALVGAPMPSAFDASGPDDRTVYLNLPEIEASGYDEEDLAEAGAVDVGALVGGALDIGLD